MRRFHLFLLLLFAMHSAYSQIADAGPNKAICLGSTTGVTLGNMPFDPKLCYSWKASPDDPSIANAGGPQITVNPHQTTTYTLTVTGQNFGSISTSSATVDVITLTGPVVKEIAEPTSFYELLDNTDAGSIFKNGTFSFKVYVGSDNPNLNLNWDLYSLRLSGEEFLLNKGTGNDFFHTFLTDADVAAAGCILRVRFFVDNNRNCKLDDGECFVQGYCEVKEINRHYITVAQASTTPPLSNPAAALILQAGTNMLKIKDTKDDYRCATEFELLGSVGLWTPSSSMPDVIRTATDMININKNVTTTVKIVKQIIWCKTVAPAGFFWGGCTGTGLKNTVVVIAGRGASTWIHEYGHSLGLGHRPPDPATNNPADFNNLMYPENKNTQFIINKMEGKKFESR